MSPLASLALASGIICALAPLAQAARIGTTGSADDVSLIWLCLYAAGSVVWTAYGAAIGSLPLVISQAIALVSVGIALLLVARYRHTRQPSAVNAARPRRATVTPPPNARHRVLDHGNRVTSTDGTRAKGGS
jgi:MtN3 and saliva related transmembrane protein